MMRPELIQTLVYSGYMIAALVGAMLCLTYYRCVKKPRSDKTHLLLMIFVFVAAVLCWVGTILNFVDYRASVWYHPFFLLAMMLNMVLLYHFVFIITATGNNRKLPVVHYIVPLALAAAMGIWSACVPFDVKYAIFESRGQPQPGYPVFSTVYFYSSLLFCVYNVFYVVLGLRRVKRYRKAVVNYSADVERTSLKWLYVFLCLIFFSIPIPLSTILAAKIPVFGHYLFTVLSVIPFVQYVIIAYNTISGNYVIIEPSTEEEQAMPVRAAGIDRKRLERYMREKSPYLNPNLRITEVAVALHTNRSYISTFINKEYGMNFSRFINCRRLEELDRLRTSPQSAEHTNMEIVLMAGFGSYRSYLRVKGEEDRRKTLKVDE